MIWKEDKMITNKEKAELIISISSLQSAPVVQSIVKLIDIFIDEARIDNDTADINVVKRNQGGIALLSTLKDYIQKGLPSSN